MSPYEREDREGEICKDFDAKNKEIANLAAKNLEERATIQYLEGLIMRLTDALEEENQFHELIPEAREAVEK